MFYNMYIRNMDRQETVAHCLFVPSLTSGNIRQSFGTPGSRPQDEAKDAVEMVGAPKKKRKKTPENGVSDHAVRRHCHAVRGCLLL